LTSTSPKASRSAIDSDDSYLPAQAEQDLLQTHSSNQLVDSNSV